MEDKDPFNNAPDFVKVLTNDEVSKLYNKGVLKTNKLNMKKCIYVMTMES